MLFDYNFIHVHYIRTCGLSNKYKEVFSWDLYFDM